MNPGWCFHLPAFQHKRKKKKSTFSQCPFDQRLCCQSLSSKPKNAIRHFRKWTGMMTVQCGNPLRTASPGLSSAGSEVVEPAQQMDESKGEKRERPKNWGRVCGSPNAPLQPLIVLTCCSHRHQGALRPPGHLLQPNTGIQEADTLMHKHNEFTQNLTAIMQWKQNKLVVKMDSFRKEGRRGQYQNLVAGVQNVKLLAGEETIGLAAAQHD